MDQLATPGSIRLTEGDYLEAEAVEQGILLKPVRVVEQKKAREDAGKVRAQMPMTLPPHHKRAQGQEGEAP